MGFRDLKQLTTLVISMFLGKESDEQRGDVGGLEYVFGELTQQLRFRSQLVDRILQYDLFSK